MLGLGWLALRQAQEALRTGRLEEAQRLLGQPSLQGHKRCWELQQHLAGGLVQRGERHLQGNDPTAAWTDLLRAEQLGLTEPAILRLRQELTRQGLGELRALLQAGEATRAVECVAQLRDRAVRLPELDPLEEAAKDWVKARDQADRGEFAQALGTLDRVGELLATRPAALGRLRQALTERADRFTRVQGELHEAARQERWQEVVRLADQVLAVAPQHVEARRLRSKAWKAIEPATLLTPGRAQTVPPEAPPEGSSQRFLLWIDGVGGYLVCLGNRVTLGQATPDACADVPLFADVSRLHAVLTRDAEGYLLEARRPVLVNGRPTDKTLLHAGDRFTLGTTCQLHFRQPVPVSASARLDLASGHRLRLAVDAVLLMADTLVIGPGPQAHVVADLKQPVILYRHKEGVALRHAEAFSINGRPCVERAVLEPGAVVAGEDFSLNLEPAGSAMLAVS